MKSSSRIIGMIASALLAIMGMLHISGFQYFMKLIRSSDLSPMIKDVFPVLFALPSIQLISLSIFGLIEIFSHGKSRAVFRVISLLVLLDAVMALYLAAWLPSILLIVPAGLFLMLSYRE